jgi:glucose-1-phosphate cytidylyltransferase
VKAVILAGGLGSRIMEETQTRPKPMVEIGGRPILWHILKIYSHFGVNDFIICLGYKGYVIKEYFANYFMHASDVTFDLGANTTHVHNAQAEEWRVTLVDTGPDSMTGGRLKRVREFIGDQTFCLTYGDAVSDVDIQALIDHHRTAGRLATVTAVQPPARWGAMRLDADRVVGFEEKPVSQANWINGGFFVVEPSAIDYIASDATAWEGEPMERLVAEDQLSAFPHAGFWQPMDTLRDRNQLEHLWASGQAAWRRW